MTQQQRDAVVQRVTAEVILALDEVPMSHVHRIRIAQDAGKCLAVLLRPHCEEDEGVDLAALAAETGLRR